MGVVRAFPKPVSDACAERIKVREFRCFLERLHAEAAEGMTEAKEQGDLPLYREAKEDKAMFDELLAALPSPDGVA